MAVCLFTFHAYGTWWPDHPKGYTTKGDGVLPPNEAMASLYRGQANFDPVNFDDAMQRVLVTGAHDVCLRRRWRFHAIGTDPTHAHHLISRSGYFDFITVRDKLKNLLSLFLGRHAGISGRQWFAAGGSNKQVKDRPHFDYLINTYLPDHRGLFWKEGQSLPELRDGVL